LCKTKGGKEKEGKKGKKREKRKMKKKIFTLCQKATTMRQQHKKLLDVNDQA
jgi:hypothetical protein